MNQYFPVYNVLLENSQPALNKRISLLQGLSSLTVPWMGRDHIQKCKLPVLKAGVSEGICPLPAMACGSAEYSCTSTTQQSRAALSFFNLEAEGATLKRPLGQEKQESCQALRNS